MASTGTRGQWGVLGVQQWGYMGEGTFFTLLCLQVSSRGGGHPFFYSVAFHISCIAAVYVAFPQSGTGVTRRRRRMPLMLQTYSERQRTNAWPEDPPGPWGVPHGHCGTRSDTPLRSTPVWHHIPGAMVTAKP